MSHLLRRLKKLETVIVDQSGFPPIIPLASWLTWLDQMGFRPKLLRAGKSPPWYCGPLSRATLLICGRKDRAIGRCMGKSALHRRLQTLELRAREVKLAGYPPGYWHERLMQKLDQIRSRIPPEQRLAYESEANAEQRERDVEEIQARLRAWREERRESALR